MKQLSTYNLTLKKWKLPYFKKYVRGEITYKEYAPSISDLAKTLINLIPIFYQVAIGSEALSIMSKSLKGIKNES